MDTSTFETTIGQIRDYIYAHPWLNQLIRFLILAAVAFALYRLLMSPWGRRLRALLPFMKDIQGEKGIRDLIQSGEFARAGEELARVGQYKEAIDVFQRGHLYARAADVYVRMKLVEKAAALYERAGEHEKAAEIYLQQGDYARVEANYERMGRWEELGEIFEKRGELSLAANSYLRSEQFKPAAAILLRLEKTGEAGEAFYQAFGQAKKQTSAYAQEGLPPEVRELARSAAQQFEKVGANEKAGKIFLEISEPKDAARCFSKHGAHKKAAQLAEEVGDLEAASHYLEQAGDLRTSSSLQGEHLVQEGKLEEALIKFQSAGDFRRAAEIYADLEEKEKAAEMYEMADEPGLAAELFRELGQLEAAGRAFEKAGELEQAAACYGQADLGDKEIHLLKETGNLFKIAERHYDKQELAEALEVLDQVTENDPNQRAAMALKGKIYLDLGEPLQAKHCLDQAVAGANRFTRHEVNALYTLAVASEQTDESSQALQTLERALAQNLVEEDAQGEAENVRKILTERAFTRMSRLTAAREGGKKFYGGDETPSFGESTKAKVRRYVPIREIGRGGMGVVYTARDTTLDRVVALKVLPSSLKKNQRAVQTFMREAKSAGQLNHPNIVTIHDTGIQDGDYFIAMEFIQGKTIKELLIKNGKFTKASILEVLRQLLAALAYAHTHKVVHRDLTTSNFMWTKQKSIKVMDFGLAKVIRELASEQSIIGGTPSFMSPEQTLGKPIDHRTDIYSLGICIYEMSVGELPFTKGDLGYHHLHTPPPSPKEKVPDLPDIFEEIVLKCMEKSPSDRYQDISEIQELFRKGV